MRKTFCKSGVVRLLVVFLVCIIGVAMTIVPIFAEEPMDEITEGTEIPGEALEEGAGPTETPEESPEEVPEETPEEKPEETPKETPEEIPEEETGGKTENVPSETPVPAEPDVFTRLWEYAVAYSAEIMSFLSAASICVYAFYQKNKNGLFFSGIRKLLETQGDTRDITGEVFNGQKDLTGKLNDVSEQMTALSQEMAADKAEIAELKKTLAANAVETMAVLEILHIAYINNPNIPQSMKNLITAKYAGVLTKINKDEELSRAFAEMRAILGIGGSDDEGKAD